MSSMTVTIYLVQSKGGARAQLAIDFRCHAHVTPYACRAAPRHICQP